MKARKDDFQERRKHLENYSDQQLKKYFFDLTDQLLDPILDLARDYTTPAIERSILMRMGFSSLEAKAITDRLLEYQLLQYGAGHVVYRYANDEKIDIRQAGLSLLESHAVQKMVEVFKNA
jgi:D-ornithine 4,5-aminomutase subunit alpha